MPNAAHIHISEKAVGILSLSKYIEQTDPVYKELNLIKVNDIYNLQVLKFYHQLINKQLPKYFNNTPYTNMSLKMLTYINMAIKKSRIYDKK